MADISGQVRNNNPPAGWLMPSLSVGQPGESPTCKPQTTNHKPQIQTQPPKRLSTPNPDSAFSRTSHPHPSNCCDKKRKGSLPRKAILRQKPGVMTDVRSKNLYELLGNDPELDSDREPEPPTKTIDKPAARHGKRDAPREAPSAPPTAPRGGARGGRGGRGNGNEDAFRDRNAGSYNNRNRPVDEVKEAGRRGYRGRDDRGARTRTDRHPVRTGHTDSDKQIGQGWGGKKGDAEWNDEKAGEAIAKADENEPQTPLEGGEAAAAPEEPVDKSKSYADYLAEQAAAKRGDLGVKEARAPNEGTKDKKWESAKEFKRDGDEENYIKPQEEKGKRERQRKEKNFLEVDMRFVEQPRGRGNGPRGAARGGRGGRGGRGDGPARGGRGGAAAAAPAVKVDEKNFPSLGGK
ncbi:hypothetical protein UA08_04073 [Talaromyces atroroseus]|uniref:Hyaluronan/mRNA-binding protein domain-containing protein n=1 Tax=Talaromyces atroroseus TaxID=1441469 RepID=A0A1Q5Q841_TALAT|nr:hypothetical protein UA08_04073 [Talaromyces atroroseus]OKL60296.1 hypothetical protein UA08_04073 [Talaromyces atroroseus]